jgi:biotin synthase
MRRANSTMKNIISDIIENTSFTRQDIAALLSATDPEESEIIRRAAHRVVLDNCGPTVWLRGLVEFSNRCVNDCLYCGIRKSNAAVRRYRLSKEEILDAARFCADAGYGSIVLQSGERRDEGFISFVEDVVRSIKRRTISRALPRGLGVTLSVGEQTPDAYRRFFDAGAHRYLLRIETSSPRLFARIHPPHQTIETRIECLKSLAAIGYQVGTGVMIGLPGQTVQDLADDILFFKGMDIDMIGMGPYIVHRRTPMAGYGSEIAERKNEIFALALRMIAVTRLALPDVNIASTTALQAMDPFGREMGLLHGANVVMPQATPKRVRKEYRLYEGKPCLEEDAAECGACIRERLRSIGREAAANEWGDSRHFSAKAVRMTPHSPKPASGNAPE